MVVLRPSTSSPLFPTGSLALPAAAGSDSKPYIFSITPAGPARLILSHGTPNLTILDRNSLNIVDTWSADDPKSEVSSVVVGPSGQDVWTAGKDGVVRTWDARVKGGRAGSNQKGMRVPGGKTTPLLSLAYASEHNLLAAGTELTNHEASIVYWDPRSPANPLYTHTTIHSDDITTLSFAPSSLHSLSLPLEPSSPSDEPRSTPQTSAILLSGSTDGTLSLTNAKENDEDEAQLGVGNVGVSVAEAGWTGRGWEVWGRDDMDGVSVWDASEFTVKAQEATLRVATSEETDPSRAWNTDYLISLLPALPCTSTIPLSLVGSNEGHMALVDRKEEESMAVQSRLNSTHRGHRDVVRSSFYSSALGQLFTGSEDGVLCSWTLYPPAQADVEMDDEEVDQGGAMAEDEELGGGSKRRRDEDAEVLGGDGGWGGMKRGRRDR